MKNNLSNEIKAKLLLSVSMLIFGTIGVFRRYIPLSSEFIALIRGLIGTLFLLGVMLITNKRFDKSAVKKNIVLICVSGAMIGFNWIFLFEAYNYTSVAVATLCYYMAPIFVMIASPIILKEPLSVKRIPCIICALFGMVMVSGVLGNGGAVSDADTAAQELSLMSLFESSKGILFGLAAAILYAGVIVLNKKMKEISSYYKTVIQLASSAAVLLPYTVITGNIDISATVKPTTLIPLLVVGIVHTGIAYLLYFCSIGQIKAQSAALLSYIDPAFAIVLSAAVLQESMGAFEMIGTVLILGSAIVSELPERKIQ